MAARAVAVIAVVILLSAGAGCLDDRPLTKEEAPLGRHSMAVPAERDGDTASHWLNQSGRRLHLEIDGEEEQPRLSVRDFDTRIALTREVAHAGQATDRFGRAFESVRIGVYKRTLSAPADADTFHVDVEDQDKVYELASGTAKFVDRHSKGTLYLEDDSYPFDARRRDYLDLGPPAGTGQLAGHVLVLGKTTSWNYTVSADFGAVYRYYVNLTPVRATYLDGVRLFEVEPRQGFEVVRPPVYPPEIQAQLDEMRAQRASSKTPTVRQEPPQFKNSVWYSATCPYPVKWEYRYSFSYQAHRVIFNETGELAQCNRGTSPIPWRTGTALQDVDRLPEAANVSVAEFHTRSTGGVKYPLANAWANVRDDPLLRDFQAHRGRHADAHPWFSLYMPNAKDNAYTWDFGITGGLGMTVASRLTDLPAGVPADIYQNMEESRAPHGGFMIRPLEKEVRESTRVVTLADALRVYGTLQSEAEPVVAIRFGVRDFLDDEPVMHADLRPQSAMRGSSLFFSAANPVTTVDLRDGGLVGVNVSFDSLFGVYRGPWASVPRPQTAAHAAMEILMVADLQALEMPFLPTARAGGRLWPTLP